jgi:hypothetical protein
LLSPNLKKSGGSISGQIIAGAPAELGMFPWQASVMTQVRCSYI